MCLSVGERLWHRVAAEDEVLAERDERLYEAGAASAMMVLASIEAAFRVDYLRRCYAKHRDGLSRTFRISNIAHAGNFFAALYTLFAAWRQATRGRRSG